MLFRQKEPSRIRDGEITLACFAPLLGEPANRPNGDLCTCG